MNVSGFLQSSSSLSSKFLYVLNRLDLKPYGGSIVILTLFYRTDIGKAGLGIEVNHSLKSLWRLSLSSSTILSSSGIHEIAKWQFYSKLHPPFDIISRIIRSAFGPYPWPSDIESTLLDIFCSSANLRKSATGSEPADSTNIKGVIGLESL